MEKFIKTVTVTGADDRNVLRELLEISCDYSFAEFGILLSKKHFGAIRYPSRSWLEKLHNLAGSLPFGRKGFNLSGHICGEWVRKLCVGEGDFFEELDPIWEIFQRFQLNFHGEPHKFLESECVGIIKGYLPGKTIIVQMDGVNDHILHTLRANNIDAVPLFDKSSGAGILPDVWPKKLADIYCGYAGGLSPENLANEIPKLFEQTGPSPIWIDAETLLRTAFGSEGAKYGDHFDLKKVRDFLTAAQPWVI